MIALAVSPPSRSAAVAMTRATSPSRAWTAGDSGCCERLLRWTFDARQVGHRNSQRLAQSLGREHPLSVHNVFKKGIEHDGLLCSLSASCAYSAHKDQVPLESIRNRGSAPGDRQ